jgi:hypothetical protein
LITQKEVVDARNRHLNSLLLQKHSHIYEVVHGMNIPILESVKEIKVLDMLKNHAVVVMNINSDIPNESKSSSVIELVYLLTLGMIRSIEFYQSKVKLFVIC